MKHLIKKSTTSKLFSVFVPDSSSSTGAGLTGLVFNSSGLSAFYYREGAGSGATQISLVTQTLGTWVSGGFVEIDSTNMPGWYEIGVPDAALATGSDSVGIQLKGAANMAPTNLEIQLSDFDVNDGVRGNLTALPNAAADAPGGLPISDAGGLNLDTNVADGLAAFWTTPGTLVDLVWDEVLTGGTHNVTNSAGRRLRQVEAAAVLHTGTAQAGSSNTITLDTGASSINDFYNHARVTVVAGTGSEQERIILGYAGSTKVAKVAPPWRTIPDATSEFDVMPATVHAETGAGTLKIGLAQSSTSNTVVLDNDASSTDDFYNGDLLRIDAGTGEGQLRVVIDYVGSTRTATVHENWTTNPDTTSEYVIDEAHPYLFSYGQTGVGLTGIPSVGSVSGSVGSVVGHTPQTGDSFARIGSPAGASVSADIAALPTSSTINAEVLDVMNVDTYGEPGQGAPSSAASIFTKINYLYKSWRNKKDGDGVTNQLYNDAGSVVDQKQTTAESGGTVTKGEWGSGP